jgi:hypothetical protein
LSDTIPKNGEKQSIYCRFCYRFTSAYYESTAPPVLNASLVDIWLDL